VGRPEGRPEMFQSLIGRLKITMKGCGLPRPPSLFQSLIGRLKIKKQVYQGGDGYGVSIPYR